MNTKTAEAKIVAAIDELDRIGAHRHPSVLATEASAARSTSRFLNQLRRELRNLDVSPEVAINIANEAIRDTRMASGLRDRVQVTLNYTAR